MTSPRRRCSPRAGSPTRSPAWRTAGLVRRENCESDRRGLYAVLTGRAWETMQKVAPHHVASVRKHFIDLLTPEALADLRESLSPVAEHLRGRRGKQ